MASVAVVLSKNQELHNRVSRRGDQSGQTRADDDDQHRHWGLYLVPWTSLSEKDSCRLILLHGVIIRQSLGIMFNGDAAQKGSRGLLQYKMKGRTNMGEGCRPT